MNLKYLGFGTVRKRNADGTYLVQRIQGSKQENKLLEWTGILEADFPITPGNVVNIYERDGRIIFHSCGATYGNMHKM
jgi:hypothetical protein